MIPSEDTIIVYVEGGVIQDITNIPKKTTVTVVDFDIDGIEENKLTKVNDLMALVSEWRSE